MMGTIIAMSAVVAGCIIWITTMIHKHAKDISDRDARINDLTVQLSKAKQMTDKIATELKLKEKLLKDQQEQRDKRKEEEAKIEQAKENGTGIDLGESIVGDYNTRLQDHGKANSGTGD